MRPGARPKEAWKRWRSSTEPQAAVAAGGGKAAESFSALALVGAPSRGFGSDFGSGHAFGRSQTAPCCDPCFCSGSGSCPFDSSPCPCPCRDPCSCSCCGCCCCFCFDACDPCCGSGSGSGCPSSCRGPCCPSGSFAIRGLGPCSCRGPCCRLCPDDRCRAAATSWQLREPWLCWPAPAGLEPGA